MLIYSSISFLLKGNDEVKDKTYNHVTHIGTFIKLIKGLQTNLKS